MEQKRPNADQPLEKVWSADLPAEGIRLADEYASLAPERDAIYISTPITTGPKYLEWRSSAGAVLDPNEQAYDDALKKQVVAENIHSAGPLARKVRTHFPDRLVINPTDLEVAEWKQLDYHRFWLEVIERVVSVAVFADGWHLSTGCTLEYLHCRRKRIPCLSANLEPLTPQRATELLTIASAELAAAHLDGTLAMAAAKVATPDESLAR